MKTFLDLKKDPNFESNTQYALTYLDFESLQQEITDINNQLQGTLTKAKADDVTAQAKHPTSSVAAVELQILIPEKSPKSFRLYFEGKPDHPFDDSTLKQNIKTALKETVENQIGEFSLEQFSTKIDSHTAQLVNTKDSNPDNEQLELTVNRKKTQQTTTITGIGKNDAVIIALLETLGLPVKDTQKTTLNETTAFTVDLQTKREQAQLETIWRASSNSPFKVDIKSTKWFQQNKVNIQNLSTLTEVANGTEQETLAVQVLLDQLPDNLKQQPKEINLTVPDNGKHLASRNLLFLAKQKNLEKPSLQASNFPFPDKERKYEKESGDKKTEVFDVQDYMASKAKTLHEKTKLLIQSAQPTDDINSSVCIADLAFERRVTHGHKQQTHFFLFSLSIEEDDIERLAVSSDQIEKIKAFIAQTIATLDDTQTIQEQKAVLEDQILGWELENKDIPYQVDITLVTQEEQYQANLTKNGARSLHEAWINIQSITPMLLLHANDIDVDSERIGYNEYDDKTRITVKITNGNKAKQQQEIEKLQRLMENINKDAKEPIFVCDDLSDVGTAIDLEENDDGLAPDWTHPDYNTNLTKAYKELTDEQKDNLTSLAFCFIDHRYKDGEQCRQVMEKGLAQMLKPQVIVKQEPGKAKRKAGEQATSEQIKRTGGGASAGMFGGTGCELPVGGVTNPLGPGAPSSHL